MIRKQYNILSNKKIIEEAAADTIDYYEQRMRWENGLRSIETQVRNAQRRQLKILCLRKTTH